LGNDDKPPNLFQATDYWSKLNKMTNDYFLVLKF
jgi:hypothetical protein